jgi:hypothetical protein
MSSRSLRQVPCLTLGSGRLSACHRQRRAPVRALQVSIREWKILGSTYSPWLGCLFECTTQSDDLVLQRERHILSRRQFGSCLPIYRTHLHGTHDRFLLVGEASELATLKDRLALAVDSFHKRPVFALSASMFPDYEQMAHAGPWHTADTTLPAFQNSEASFALTSSNARSMTGPCPPT